MGDNNQFRTSDTSLAAYLITQGFPLISIDYDKPRFEHCFEASPTTQNAADLYIVGRALTDPSDFTRIYRKLIRILKKHCQWEED